ncbi:DEAD/DEAH box helicase family protein [Paenibacillus sp. FSL H3-0333]|uniref:DEAD/DEAH box helicase family protein n=1 Tax=Paenibacillus sp. FSL H3-0333 TaxID=2921373 RepID=UPI0030F4CC01
MIKEEYKLWNEGDIVLIGTGTGSGKSYFIRNHLSAYANEEGEEILIIFNRKQLHEQNKEHIRKDNNFRVHTATYQEIEQSIINNGSYDFSKYKYIVCDECHYFTDDSGFNHNSDISFNAIMNQTNKIKIFMSATGGSLFSFIKENHSKPKIWNYRQKKNYDHIASLNFYTSNDAVENFIQHKFRNDEKIIWFCKSVEKAAKLHAKYPDSYFLCSISNKNKKHLKLLEEDTFKTTDGKTTFDRKYLFTTKVLDNGFDLKDEKIKLIIVDEFEINTIIQCLGRKRILSDTDKVHVVLFNHSNRSINGYKSLLINKLNEVEAFMEGGVEGRNNFVGRFAHRSNYIIYDEPSTDNKFSSNKRVSRVKQLKAENDLSIIDEMLNNNRELNKLRSEYGEKKRSDAFVMYILELLNKDRCADLDRIYEQQELAEYLDSTVGRVFLMKNQKEELIDKINVRVDGHQLKSANSLNAALCERGFNFVIKEFETSRILDGKKKKFKCAWKVMRLTDK